MKRMLGLLIFCLLMTTLSKAQTSGDLQQPEQETLNNAMPVISFETTEIDYGVIEQNADPYREFHFTNVGEAPLVISNAKGSCGCTVPEWTKAPIAPGETSIVKVRYATNRIGKFSKTVTLTTNDQAGQHLLRIKGEVLKPQIDEGVPPAPVNGFNGSSNENK